MFQSGKEVNLKWLGGTTGDQSTHHDEDVCPQNKVLSDKTV